MYSAVTGLLLTLLFPSSFNGVSLLKFLTDGACGSLMLVAVAGNILLVAQEGAGGSLLIWSRLPHCERCEMGGDEVPAALLARTP